MEWNELPEKDRTDYIRKGVSLGYRTLEDIQQHFNEFDKGGKKYGISDKQAFIKQLDQELQNNPFFNTPQWRQYFIDLAGKESSYRNVTNNIGASGYFQLMPYNRHTGNQFQDMFNLTKRNYLALQKHLNTSDFKQMNKVGTDIYGLLAGMHLGGSNAIKALRTYGTPNASNAKDANGTSVLGYMRRFSQRSSEVPILYDNEPALVQNTIPYVPLPKTTVTAIDQEDTNTHQESFEPEVQKISISNLIPDIQPQQYQIASLTTTEPKVRKDDVISDILNEPLSVLQDNKEYNEYINTSALGGQIFKDGGRKNPYERGTRDWYEWESEHYNKSKHYVIPFIKDKAMTLTDAGDFTGAVVSTNVLDSIAKNANNAGLGIIPALGLTHESTLGNPTDTRQAYNMSSSIRRSTNYTPYPTEQHINSGNDIDERELINFWDAEHSPFGDELGEVDRQTQKYGWSQDQVAQQLMNDTIPVLRQAGEQNYSTPYAGMPTLEAGFRFFKDNPEQYNSGAYYSNGYAGWVDRKGRMLWHSPEIQQWWQYSPYNPDNIYDGQPMATYEVPIGRIHVNDDGSISSINTNPTITNGNILLNDVIVTPQ